MAKQNFEEIYKNHLLCIRRNTVGRDSGFTAYAMVFREPNNSSEPFAGRIELTPRGKIFVGKGAQKAALDAIKNAVDA